VDGQGHRHLDPQNPDLGNLSRDRAREDELRELILEKLSWIRGLQVWVQLIERREARPPADPATNPAPRPPSSDLSAIAVNQPAEPPQPAPPPPSPVAAPHQPAAAISGAEVENGHVLINVPRSYYLNAILPRSDHREPNLEERLGMAARTKEQILKMVRLVVPESWPVDVDTIPDDVSPGRMALHPS